VLKLEDKRFLRILAKGRTDFNGGRHGPWTVFRVEAQGEGVVVLQGVKAGRWLQVQDGEFTSSLDPQPLRVELCPEYEASEAMHIDEAMPAGPAPLEMPAVDHSVLSAADIAHFKEQGYIIIRDAVPQGLINEALRSINYQLGRPDCWQVDPDPLNAAQLQLKLPKDIGCAIFNQSPKFWSVVNTLLGEGKVGPWGNQGHEGQRQGQQVALRFPQPPSKGFNVPDVKPGTQYHIDGMGQNKLCPFSLLCGVAVSEQAHPNMGNLHVFPGSHLHEGLRGYYRDKIDDDSQGEDDQEKPDLGASVQVLLQPGDIVIAHQLLAHRVGVNTSAHIRYQLYYRVSSKDHAQLKDQIIDDPWVEFAI